MFSGVAGDSPYEWLCFEPNLMRTRIAISFLLVCPIVLAALFLHHASPLARAAGNWLEMKEAIDCLMAG